MTTEDAIALLDEIQAQALVPDPDAERAREELLAGRPPTEVLEWLAKRAVH